METKREIRKRILSARRGLTPAQCRTHSDAIMETLLATDLYRQAGSVCAYVDVQGEVMTERLIRQAWADGKRVAVPKVSGDDLIFYEIHSYGDLQPGYFGIPEPVDCKELQDPAPLVIVPGVAFDRRGSRIGYGKGFYDRFLKTRPLSSRIAIAYEMQLVDRIPAEEHDIRQEILITEKQIYRNQE